MLAALAKNNEMMCADIYDNLTMLNNSLSLLRAYEVLSRESTERLVHAFITSRLDYCNGLLYGAPDYQIKKLQRVMNASARLVYRAPKYCHKSPLVTSALARRF